MFLDLIRRRNPQLIEQAIFLHQQGKLPANAYVIDLDAVEENARTIASEAAKFGWRRSADEFLEGAIGVGTSAVSRPAGYAEFRRSA